VHRSRDRGEKQIVAWGTGSASREFLYVEDCAEGLIASLEKYDSPEPMNLGSGREISIRDLTHLVAKLASSRVRSSGTPPNPTDSPAMPGRNASQAGDRVRRGDEASKTDCARRSTGMNHTRAVEVTCSVSTLARGTGVSPVRILSKYGAPRFAVVLRLCPLARPGRPCHPARRRERQKRIPFRPAERFAI